MELREAKSEGISKLGPIISDFLEEHVEDFDLSNHFTGCFFMGWDGF